MKHFYVNWILTLGVLLLLASIGQSQTEETEKRYPASKYELGMGLGIDHSGFGFKGKYNLTEKLGVYVAVGVLQASLVPPSVGFHYKLLESESSKWSGYVLSQVGMIRLKANAFLNPPNNTMFVEDSQRQFTYTIGAGAMWRNKQKYSVNLGLTFTIYDSKKAQKFYDDFNAEHGLDFHWLDRASDFGPIIGVNRFF